MIFIKPGVKMNGVRPEIVMAANIAHWVYRDHGYDLTITEFTGGQHSKGSLHYVGAAMDLRTRIIPDDAIKQKIADRLQACLGEQFDVVLEPTHIHVEYQPDS